MPIFNELIKPTVKRTGKVITRTTVIMSMVYIACGLSGYFATYDKTPALMLERKSLDGKRITTPMLLANLAMILLMFVHVPVNYVAARGLIIQLKYGKTQDNFTFKENFTITFIFTCLLVSVAIVFPDIIKVFSILGGLCSPIIAFIVPTLCYVKLRTKKWTEWKNLTSIVLCVTLSVFGFASVLITLYQLVTEGVET